MTENDHVTVSIVGTGGAEATTPDGTVGQTPFGQPNLLINVVKPATAIVVRAAHVFLMTFVGALGSGAVGATPADWTWKTAAAVAAGAAFLETVKNLVTIFADLENKNPLLTGSI